MAISSFDTSRAATRRSGFTLVELLVATAVTVLLVVVLVRVFNDTAGTWRRSEAQVDAFREARGALQLMARDLSATLQASYAQAGGGTGSTANPAVPTLVLQRNPAAIPDPAGPGNEEVYFLTNIPNKSNVTGVEAVSPGLCAVGYYCAWMPDIDQSGHAPRAFALMRQSLDSNQTFLRLKTAGGSTAPMTFDALFSQTTAPKPSITQMAAYVWDLRFRIDTDLNEATVPDGNVAGGPVDHSSSPRTYDARGGAYPPRLPPYVEIRFRALSSVAARQLEAAGSPVDKATWRDSEAGVNSVPAGLYRQIILPNCQQFVLRVPFTNATPLPTPAPAP